MRLNFGGVFADAGAIWRAERDVLVPVAGVFAFLPVLALGLFVPTPELDALADEALWEAVVQWYAANGIWLALTMLVQFFGAATILVLLLDAARPPIGRAMARVVGLMPALLLGALGVGLLVGLGSMLLLVPGLYAIGRCYLVWPVLVAEPQRGAPGGFGEALRLTGGNGWRLFAVTMTVLLPAYFLVQILGAAGDSAGQLGNAVVAILVALVSAASGVAQLLLQVAAYRRLRQGI